MVNSISDVSLKAVDALGRLDLASSLSYDFKEIYEEEDQSVSSSEISLGSRPLFDGEGPYYVPEVEKSAEVKLTKDIPAESEAEKCAEAKLAEIKPTEDNSAENKPVEVESRDELAEDKSAEDKSSEAKPAVGEPAKEKPIENNPAENKSVIPDLTESEMRSLFQILSEDPSREVNLCGSNFSVSSLQLYLYKDSWLSDLIINQFLSLPKHRRLKEDTVIFISFEISTLQRILCYGGQKEILRVIRRWQSFSYILLPINIQGLAENSFGQNVSYLFCKTLDQYNFFHSK